MGFSWITETFKKKWIRCIFFLENGQLDFRTCQYEDNNSFKVKKCAYIVDQKLIHYDKHIPYLLYLEGNPNPISIIRTKNVVNGKVISSENFNDILDSKVIKEMVSSGQAESLLLILMCVLILIGLLNLGAAAGIFDPKIVNATVNMTANMTNVVH